MIGTAFEALTTEGVTTLLPDAVAARVGAALLEDVPARAALRVLATVRDERWQPFVHPDRIDWDGMLGWAIAEATESVWLRTQAAASLAGQRRACVSLLRLAEVLDGENLGAVVDGLRLACEGVAW